MLSFSLEIPSMRRPRRSRIASLYFLFFAEDFGS